MCPNCQRKVQLLLLLSLLHPNFTFTVDDVTACRNRQHVPNADAM